MPRISMNKQPDMSRVEALEQVILLLVKLLGKNQKLKQEINNLDKKKLKPNVVTFRQSFSDNLDK